MAKQLFRLECPNCDWAGFRHAEPTKAPRLGQDRKPLRCPQCNSEGLEQIAHTGPAITTAPNGQRVTWDYDNSRWSPA